MHNHVSNTSSEPLLVSDRLEEAASILLLEQAGSHEVVAHLLMCLSGLGHADVKTAIRSARYESHEPDRDKLQSEARYMEARNVAELARNFAGLL